jgi:hypothetical protein
MAATVAINTTLPQRAAAPLLTLAAIPLTIDANGATYATGSGGLPVDLFAALAAASPLAANINYKDIVEFHGISRAGYTVGQFAIGTATSTTLPCTLQLWNGTTEFADGACSQVIDGLLFVARGGAN